MLTFSLSRCFLARQGIIRIEAKHSVLRVASHSAASGWAEACHALMFIHQFWVMHFVALRFHSLEILSDGSNALCRKVLLKMLRLWLLAT